MSWDLLSASILPDLKRQQRGILSIIAGRFVIPSTLTPSVVSGNRSVGTCPRVSAVGIAAHPTEGNFLPGRINHQSLAADGRREKLYGCQRRSLDMESSTPNQLRAASLLIVGMYCRSVRAWTPKVANYGCIFRRSSTGAVHHRTRPL